MNAVFTSLNAHSTALHFEVDGTALSWRDLIAGLHHEATVRTEITNALLAAPFSAFFWETRPVGPLDCNSPFESIILNASRLANIRADAGAFDDPLGKLRAPAVLRFPNLSGDAELVVPAPGDDPAGYPHLAAFLRSAPTEQRHALWVELARGVTEWLDTRGTRVWVSTAGLGVSWLHIRLDSQPKYIKWAPYR